MIKPSCLKRGDKVAIVSLSSGLLGESFSKHEIPLGIKRLKEFGLEPVFMPHALKSIEFVKEHPKLRAQDLKDAFMTDEIKGIVCAIGGDDTYRTLPYLLEDEEFVQKVKTQPKLFTGFSDTTINHLMFYKLGMTSFYGPNFICDLAEMEEEMLPYTKRAFEQYFMKNEKTLIPGSDIWYEEREDFSEYQIGTRRNAHKEEHGYEVLQGKGLIQGTLLGGCLESLYDILSGTRYKDEAEVCAKYGLFPSKQEWKDKILFIETCEEQPAPELYEKEVAALKHAGVFESVRGILVGKPQNEKYYEEYKEILCRVVANKELPILYNMNFGHAVPRCVIPYGLEVSVDLEKREVKVEEAFLKHR